MALGKDCKERGRQLPANRNNRSQTGKCWTFAPLEVFLKSFSALCWSEACSGPGWSSPQLHRAPRPLPASSQTAPQCSSIPLGCPHPWQTAPFQPPEKGNAFVAVSACAAMVSSPFLCLSCLTVNFRLGGSYLLLSIWLPPWKTLLCWQSSLIDIIIIIIIIICNKVRRPTQGDGGSSTRLLDFVTKQFSENQISTISMYPLLSIITKISHKTKHISC